MAPIIQRRAAPLIALRDLHEDVCAGYRNASVAVRTLDGVSLDLHAGDLLIVQGRVGGGGQALVRALAAPRRSLVGRRIIADGVRLRRGSVPALARDAIIASWTAAARAETAIPDPRGTTAPEPRVAYLLRVRETDGRAAHGSDAPRSARDTHRPSHDPARAWADWAHAVCRSAGAVVLFGSAAPVRAGAVHERAAVRPRDYTPCDTRSHPDGDPSASTGRVRVLTLAAGRIVSDLRVSAAPAPPVWSSGDSGASPSPTGSSRYSTGSTAPSSRDAGACWPGSAAGS